MEKKKFDRKCTHVIMGSPTRTEKSLAACASGIWLLKTDYLKSSLQRGKFLEEKPYVWMPADCSGTKRCLCECGHGAVLMYCLFFF